MPLKLYKRPRGKIWHYRGTVAGRRLRGSTKTQDKKTAQRIAAEREAREWKRDLDGPGSVLTFAQAAMMYRSDGNDTRGLEGVEDYWKDSPIKDITEGAIKRGANHMFGHTGAPAKNRLFISPTQTVINYAAGLDLCPRISVARFPHKADEKTPATWQWIEAFCEHASPHLGAMAKFMFLTGARPGEAAALTWDDLDLSKARVLIYSTKTQTERNAHLPRPLVIELANLERFEHVFKYKTNDAARDMWRKVTERAEIEYLSMHCCRHGFATALLHKNVDPVTVARLGGWESPAHVFNTYGHASEDDTQADRIIDTSATQALAKGAKK